MPSAKTRSATRYILIAVGLTALAVTIWRLHDVVIVAFGGIVGAAVLRVMARPLARRLHVSEKWGVIGVAVGLLAAVALLGWLFGNQVGEQATDMRRVLPDAIAKVQGTLQNSAIGRAVLTSGKQAAQQSNPISGVGLAAGALLQVAADVLLVFFLSIYFALDPEEYLNGCVRLVPPSRRRQVSDALQDAGEALQKWLLAQLVAMGVIGIAVGAGLALLHVPLALLLGTIAALLEFVPVVGPILFTIPGVLIAFTQGPDRALYVLLLYVGVQQFESNVLVPILQRWAVRLPPVISLLSVVAGGLLFGGLGLIFATPLAVVVTSLVKHLYVEETLEAGESPVARRRLVEAE